MAEPLHILPASGFTIQQLTDAYNQTRVDYLVPMPMNAARLAEYVHMYDVDLERSFVALDGTQILGLAMLGVRPGRAWITRLGVLPNSRRRGQGLALMRALLSAAAGIGLGFSILEVIQHNTPAQMLFLKLNYREINDLLILRRPPARTGSLASRASGADPLPGVAHWLTRAEVLDRLRQRPNLPPWTNQTESYLNAEQVAGLSLTMPEGSGWAAFMIQRLVITHLALNTEKGDPAMVGAALLAHIHSEHPRLDTHAENIATDDPHLPALYGAGYVESFRRIQMYRGD